MPRPGGNKGPRAVPAVADFGGVWTDEMKCCSLKEELVAAEFLSAELQSE